MLVYICIILSNILNLNYQMTSEMMRGALSEDIVDDIEPEWVTLKTMIYRW